MANNRVALSGMNSGLDTDSIVTALVSGYKAKKDNYVKAQTKLEWTQDAWKDLNSKIYGFYSSTLSPMRFSSAFSVKKAQSASSKATVSASSDAVSGTQSLKIKNLATSGYLTGGVVKATSGDKIKGSTKLSELGITDGSSLSLTVDGKETNFTVDGDTTINQFVVKLKEAGVNASFDEANQRFFISSKKSGAAGDFSLKANNAAGNSLLQSLKLNTTTAADVKDFREKAALTDDELESLIQTEYTKKKAALYDLNDATAMDKVKQSLTSAKENAEKSNETLNKANADIDVKLGALSEVSGKTFEEKSALLEAADARIKELGEIKEPTEEQKAELEELKLKREVYLASTNGTFSEEGYLTELNDTKVANLEKISENQEVIDKNSAALADESGFETYINEENAKIEAANTELLSDITEFYNNQRAYAKQYIDAYDVVNDKNADKTSQEYKDALSVVGTTATGGDGAVRIVGEDAMIELNGATFTSTTNNFQINGLTITANAETVGDETISITTETDVDGIYDMIVGFFDKYNELIKEMDSLYNAPSAKGYEPLIDEEKEEMTDDEIDKWEKKVKDSLLRRDGTLQGVSDAIKSAFQKSYVIDGKSYSLASFGIKTAGYFSSGDNEKSLYHIDGNKDDDTSSGNTDKLRAAIASNPEAVCSFFNQLAQGVYDKLSGKMRGTTLSSAYTVYNDKKMKNDYNEYTKTIKKWEERIEAYEEKYRKQFTAMEKALATLNSQSSYFSGMTGGM